MHEHVNEYKIMQREYREYIETWVHEIKTPIALTKLVAENSEGKVISDEKWVEFIINQIIVNSIKYKNKEAAIIKAYTTVDTDKIILTIEDNGIGIIDKDIDKVFDKGFTGYNGRIFGKSTGIGLYLAKKLSLKLGLNITLSSKVNEGTKVSIVFPLSSLTNLTIMKDN